MIACFYFVGNFHYARWEEFINQSYEAGEINKKYTTLKEALLDMGTSEEEYSRQIEYIFKIIYMGKEYDLKIHIGPYEIVSYASDNYVLDVNNKKFLKINTADVIIDNKEIKLNNKYLIEEETYNYLDGYNVRSDYEENKIMTRAYSFENYWTIFECDEGTVEGYGRY